MANIDSKNYKLVNAVPSSKIPPFEQKGNVYIGYDEVTFAAEAAVNDIVRTALVVPKGAIVLDAMVVAPSLGATGIFQLGTAADPDALIAAADAGGQAVKQLADAGAADLLKKLTDDTNYQLKCTEATAAATGLTLKVIVKFAYVGG